MSEPEAIDTTVAVQLALLSSKIDLLLVQRDDHESRLRSLESGAESKEQRSDQENRLRALERWRWVMVGAVLASGPAWQAIAAKF